eukprot:403359214
MSQNPNKEPIQLQTPSKPITKLKLSYMKYKERDQDKLEDNSKLKLSPLKQILEDIQETIKVKEIYQDSDRSQNLNVIQRSNKQKSPHKNDSMKSEEAQEQLVDNHKPLQPIEEYRSPFQDHELLHEKKRQLDRQQRNIRYDQLPSINGASNMECSLQITKSLGQSVTQNKNKEQQHVYNRKSNSKDQVEVSEQMLGIYTGFIKRKLGLEKKISNNELYIYKYHTQLKSNPDRFKKNFMTNHKRENSENIQIFKVKDNDTFHSPRKSDAHIRRVQFDDSSLDYSVQNKSALKLYPIGNHSQFLTQLDFNRNISSSIAKQNSTISNFDMDSTSNRRKDSKSILKNYQTVQTVEANNVFNQKQRNESSLQGKTMKKKSSNSTYANFMNPNFNQKKQSIDMQSTTYNSVQVSQRVQLKKGVLPPTQFYDRMALPHYVQQKNNAEYSPFLNKRKSIENQASPSVLKQVEADRDGLRIKLREIIDNAKGRHKSIDQMSGSKYQQSTGFSKNWVTLQDSHQNAIQDQAPDFFKGIFQIDQSNTVRVASDTQFRKLTKMFNQFYEIEHIYDIEDMSQIERQKLERKLKQRQEGIKLMLLSDIDQFGGGKSSRSGMINQTKLFKLNDIQFYVDHINKMLFKTKDQWLYKKYLAYQKLVERQKLQG